MCGNASLDSNGWVVEGGARRLHRVGNSQNHAYRQAGVGFVLSRRNGGKGEIPGPAGNITKPCPKGWGFVILLRHILDLNSKRSRKKIYTLLAQEDNETTGFAKVVGAD